jgi:hypothetical protein
MKLEEIMPLLNKFAIASDGFVRIPMILDLCGKATQCTLHHETDQRKVFLTNDTDAPGIEWDDLTEGLQDMIFTVLRTTNLSLDSELPVPTWRKYKWDVEPTEVRFHGDPQSPVCRIGIKDSGNGMKHVVLINSADQDIDLTAFVKSEQDIKNSVEELTLIRDAISGLIDTFNEQIEL